MTVCVVGKESLSILEKWVDEFFGLVPDRQSSAPRNSWWGIIPPYLPQKEASALEVVPISEAARSISISW